MRVWGAVAVVALVVSACVTSNAVTCDDGRVCPQGTTCDVALSRCLVPGQREACTGLADDDGCVYAGTNGRCRAGVCSQAICGDGVQEGAEECDLDDLADSNDCTDLGYYAPGPLRCNADCTYDRSGCSGSCGDHVVEGTEDCEPGVAQTLSDCTQLGFYDAAPVGCNQACRFDVGACTGFCGDGTTNGAEDCDGTVGAATCTGLGFYDAGAPGCNAACRFDASTCSGSCGDHELNGPEVCDGRPPDGDSCVALGFTAGLLTCSSGCVPYLPSCMRQGWRLVSDYPTFAYFYDVWGTRSDDLYLVGDEGLFHSNGASTTPIAGLPSGLFGLWGSSATDVWAVGNANGYHFDGTTWTEHSPSANVFDVWGAGPADVWAVGNGIHHWDGTAWQQVVAGVSFRAVHGSARDNVWAVGNGGVAYHFDGTSWTQVATGVTWTLRSVHAFSSTSVLVGGGGGGGAGILRYDGQAWIPEVTDEWVFAFSAMSPGNVWAGVGLGVIYHFDGTAWSKRPHPNNLDTSALFAVDGTVFEVGAENALFRYDGLTVAPMASGTTADLNNVWGTSSYAVAVGDGGTIVQWDGATWSAMTSTTTTPLHAVWGSGPTDVYAAGFTSAGVGVLLHYDGNPQRAWQAVSGKTAAYSDIWGSGASDVYVGCKRIDVGTMCDSLHWDGLTWSPARPSGTDFSSVTGTGPNDVYVGQAFPASEKVLRHFDGAWTVLPWTDVGTLNAGPGATALLGPLPSNAQLLMRIDSTTRRTDINPLLTDGGGGTTATVKLHDVQVGGPGDMLAVGDGGTIARFDGTTWWAIASGVTTQLAAIGGRGRTTFAVGERGTIILIARDDDAAPCTTAGAESSCTDGIDNDCDFLVDARDPDCAGPGMCWDPPTLACNTTVTVTTHGAGAGTLRNYGCTERLKDGNEDVFRIVPPTTGTLTATLTNPSGSFDLLLLDSTASGACDPAGGCLAISENPSGDEQLTAAVVGNHAVFLVVDDEGSTGTTYTLGVTCP